MFYYYFYFYYGAFFNLLINKNINPITKKKKIKAKDIIKLSDKCIVSDPNAANYLFG